MTFPENVLVYFCGRVYARFSHSLGEDTSLLGLWPAEEAEGLLLLPRLHFISMDNPPPVAAKVPAHT